MKKLDEYGDVERVAISATTSDALFEIEKINKEAFDWLVITVMRMYRFGEAPDDHEMEEALKRYSNPAIMATFIKTIFEDSKRWSIQGRAGIKGGSKGGKASAVKRKKKTETTKTETPLSELSDIDIRAQKAAKALARMKS